MPAVGNREGWLAMESRSTSSGAGDVSATRSSWLFRPSRSTQSLIRLMVGTPSMPGHQRGLPCVQRERRLEQFAGDLASG